MLIMLTNFRSPSSGIDSRQDAMDTVWCQEPVFYALAQAVRVQGRTKIVVGIFVVHAERRGRHAKLIGWLEGFQDLPPVRVISGGTTVAFVNDDEIEEIRAEFPVQAGAVLIFGEALVQGEVHLTALVRHAAFDLHPGIAKGQEIFVLGIVNQNVAISQEQNTGLPKAAITVPAR